MIKNDPTFWKKIMKLSLLTIIISVSLSSTLLAGEVSGQGLQQKVTVRLPQQTASRAIEQLRAATGLSFYYEPANLKNIAVKDRSFDKAPVAAVLNYILLHTALTYEDKGGAIVIRPLNAAERAKRAAPGRISGKVLDEHGEPLPGASVKVVETGISTQSSVDGNYVLNLAPGTYTLEISYVSFQTQRISGVVIAEGKNSTLNIALKAASKGLQEVVVTADFKKASIAGLYARQKNAAGITDGISAEQISRTPDKNIGETLRRISGLSTLDNKYVVVRGLSERYNQAMMNGQVMPSTDLNRKNFSYDIIPTSLVDNITVTKTLTPDQSAEFGGGLVQVNTKEIPESNGLTVTFGGSINDLTTGKLYRSPEIYGSQYFAGLPDERKLFGKADWKSREDILNSGNFDSEKLAELKEIKAIPNNWGLRNYSPLPSLNGQLSLSRLLQISKDQRLGFFVSASYRNTWQSQDLRMSRDGYRISDPLAADVAGFIGNRYGFSANIGGMAGIGYSDPNNKISLQTLQLKSSNQEFIFGTGMHEAALQSAGYYDLYTFTNLWQNQLKTEHLLGTGGLKANFALNYTRLDRQKPDNHIALFNYKENGADSPLNPDVDFTASGALSSGIAAGALRSWNRALENNLGWNADLSMPYTFNLAGTQVTNVLKAGYAGWHKDRLFWVLLTGSSGFTTDRTAPLSELFEPTPGAKIYADDFGDDFHQSPSLHAGYILSDNKFGDKLRLVWGLRGEYYNVNRISEVLAHFIATDGRDKVEDLSDLYNREPAWNFFPSANMTYSLTPQMNLRLAYAKSIIRPDLRELSYFNEYDFELGGIYQSNSPILSTKIHNLDFRYEWYPSAGELISISAFYKKLLYPMEIFVDMHNTFELRNDKDAINKGIEVEVRKSLAFTGLPIIKNFTLYGNATRLFSKVRTMDIDYRNGTAEDPDKLAVIEKPLGWEKRPQSGASNYMLNAGLSYDQGSFSVNASYNYISNRFYRVGATALESLYEKPMQPLDAQVAYRLLKNHAMVKLSISNLLGSKYLIYQNHYLDQQILSGRAQPTDNQQLYDRGIDWIDYEAAAGRTYSLTFNYNF